MVVLIFCACKKERVQLVWQEKDSGTTYDLSSIDFVDDQNGFATGGEDFFKAIVARTSDGGNTWTEDVVGEKQILGLDVDESGKGYGVGYDGLLYVKEKADDNWAIKRLTRWDVHRDVAFQGEEGIIVSGIAYQNGVIQKVFDNYATRVVDTFENELSAVCYSSSNIAHVVGYGMILRSADGGNTWNKQDIEGDFFRDVYFPSAQVGYVVGYSGSILKTTDAGQTWEWLRKGDALLVKNKAFRAVHFADESRGYVVGDGGLFWWTHDGGASWKVDNEFPAYDFYDVYATNTGGFVVGEKGKIVKFDDP